jgi:hypothetical protein
MYHANPSCLYPIRRTRRRYVSTRRRAQNHRSSRTPQKHSAPGCWNPRRVAPAAERCSNAALEYRVYTRFAVTSQSKLPWTRRRRGRAQRLAASSVDLAQRFARARAAAGPARGHSGDYAPLIHCESSDTAVSLQLVLSGILPQLVPILRYKLFCFALILDQVAKFLQA